MNVPMALVVAISLISLFLYLVRFPVGSLVFSWVLIVCLDCSGVFGDWLLLVGFGTIGFDGLLHCFAIRFSYLHRKQLTLSIDTKILYCVSS